MIKITNVDHFLLQVPFVEQYTPWVPMDWPVTQHARDSMHTAAWHTTFS